MLFHVPAGNKSCVGWTKGKKAHGSDLHRKSQKMLREYVSYLSLHHKSLQTQQLITTRLLFQLPWIRNRAWLSWFRCFTIRHEVAITVSAVAGVLSEVLIRDGSAATITPKMVGRFSFSRVFGLRALVSCWLLARGHPHFLARWASPTWQLASSQPEVRTSTNEMEAAIFSMLVAEVPAHHLRRAVS